MIQLDIFTMFANDIYRQKILKNLKVIHNLFDVYIANREAFFKKGLYSGWNKCCSNYEIIKDKQRAYYLQLGISIHI